MLPRTRPTLARDIFSSSMLSFLYRAQRPKESQPTVSTKFSARTDHQIPIPRN